MEVEEATMPVGQRVGVSLDTTTMPRYHVNHVIPFRQRRLDPVRRLGPSELFILQCRHYHRRRHLRTQASVAQSCQVRVVCQKCTWHLQFCSRHYQC